MSVEKPGSPAPGFFFWYSRAFTGPFGSPIMRFLNYLGLLSATLLWLGILWAFAQDPRDLAAVA